MEIIQFEDKNLAHYSYALISNGKIALIDPARNPAPYYSLAKEKDAQIIAIIETHPHADFISSHLEIGQTTGAKIYVSKLLGAEYSHEGFDDGDEIKIGNATLKAINTPGHSPDSICILAINKEGKEKALFSGDTLFIGDCGRPDLRESAGAITAQRKELAKSMYHSLRDKLMKLPDDVIVYPAHGAGSLCGKGLSSKNASTIGAEKASNWCLQEKNEQEFLEEILANQPFVPKYFVHSVELNKKGAASYQQGIDNVKISDQLPINFKDYIIIDTRNESDYKKGHLDNSINLMNDTKFETWLGSIVSPGEPFYLIADSSNNLQILISRIARIGYESQIEMGIVATEIPGEHDELFDINKFKSSQDNFTIVDIRNATEVQNKRVFENAVEIPLPELRERVHEIPTDKPIVVHCAGGYRSAAGASIIKNHLNSLLPVLDLSYAIKEFN
jgi:glyoxylase-like metal-dependent hydrolase (beta-lactamase superfamily II)/rhodanese-related sulfurtransferase